MKQGETNANRKSQKNLWAALIFGPALLAMGCATSSEPEVTTADLHRIQQRLEDVERTNGRLMVRVEEMERQAILMQDRVETNRIALQRRGYLRQRQDEYVYEPPRGDDARRPDPAPQTHYPSRSYQADPTMHQRMEERGVARIPLSEQQSGAVEDMREYTDVPPPGSSSEEGSDRGREVVITNETIESYFGDSSSSGSSSSTNSSSQNAGTTTRRRSAHPPVTDERLATSRELNARQAPAPQTPLGPRSAREMLDLYQSALAQYRSGDYGQALQGFTAFMDSSPQENWIDNTLYWIGECHYGLNEYGRSIQYFQRILDELPQADKVPDALLKMSLAYERMGEEERSYRLLVDLVEKYPRTNPGRLGQERLQTHPMHSGN